jgi:hypothetical protein
MADALFKKYKKKIIKELGRKALADDQINKLCKELFGSKWKGVFPQDRLKTASGYYIINTDSSKHINSDSSHWVAIKMTKSTMYVYDSFGRTTRYVLPLIYANTKKKIVESKHDAEQHGAHSELCGQLSIGFLCVVNDLGIKKALEI